MVNIVKAPIEDFKNRCIATLDFYHKKNLFPTIKTKYIQKIVRVRENLIDQYPEHQKYISYVAEQAINEINAYTF